MSSSRVIGRLFASTTALAAGIGALLPGSGVPPEVTDAPVSIILAATTSAAGRAAVEHLGGQVTHDLPFIDSVAATVPAAAVSALVQEPGVLGVAPDEKAHVQGSFNAADAGQAELPLSVYREAVKSDLLEDRGGKGAGVTVALLDTGVTVGPDLDGRIMPVNTGGGGTSPCKNLSGTPDCHDGFGHGTFMAGLIVGSGALSGGAYRGVASEAKVLSIKVASDDGSADVSNVLAGIQWAVSFKDTYKIRVLNLSLGTDSTQLRSVDPLNLAVEKAWKAGITVIVAASNNGPGPRTISKPGDDPYVITVGAEDDQLTPSIGDDVVPDFSSRGPVREAPLITIHKPDVVAPGAHLVSVRALGSTIDQQFADPGNPYLEGSGTSMATAVVSGVAAQILSINDSFKPDRVKFVLRKTARPVAGGSKDTVGQGVVDAYAAGVNPPRGTFDNPYARSTGVGSLNGARGNVHVELDDDNHTVLDRNKTAQLLTFVNLDPVELWTPETWRVSQWAGRPWYDTTWSGDNWEGDNWEGCFVGGEPGDECDYGDTTSGSRWYGAWH